MLIKEDSYCRGGGTPVHSVQFVLNASGHPLSGVSVLERSTLANPRARSVPSSRLPHAVAVPAEVKSQGRLALIEAGGNLSKRLGLPRTVGQIYGLLFGSLQALSLEEIADQLGISKASVSTGTRQLVSWGAIRQVWVHGSRKDHFEAIPEIGALLRNAYREIFHPRLDAAQKRAEGVVEKFRHDREAGRISQEEFEFCRARLQIVARFQKTLQSFAPFLERLL